MSTENILIQLEGLEMAFENVDSDFLNKATGTQPEFDLD